MRKAVLQIALIPILVLCAAKRTPGCAVEGGTTDPGNRYPYAVNINGHCSGFMLTDRIAVTAGHCLYGRTSTSVRVSDGRNIISNLAVDRFATSKEYWGEPANQPGFVPGKPLGFEQRVRHARSMIYDVGFIVTEKSNLKPPPTIFDFFSSEELAHAGNAGENAALYRKYAQVLLFKFFDGRAIAHGMVMGFGMTHCDPNFWKRWARTNHREDDACGRAALGERHVAELDVMIGPDCEKWASDTPSFFKTTTLCSVQGSEIHQWPGDSGGILLLQDKSGKYVAVGLLAKASISKDNSIYTHLFFQLPELLKLKEWVDR